MKGAPTWLISALAVVAIVLAGLFAVYVTVFTIDHGRPPLLILGETADPRSQG